MFVRLAMFGVVLLCSGAIWNGLTVALIAYTILHPPRLTDGKALVRLGRLSPEDLGLPFEEVTFHVDDVHQHVRLKLAGWWIPSAVPSDRTAVLLHGYADAKVGTIAWAPVLLACGMNVLAIDLRAHGDSDGTLCTAGYFERTDVAQVLDELRQLRPAETRQLVLFGASMGAAVAAAVAVDRPGIAAIVLDSPYTDFRRALAARAFRRGLPGGVFLTAAVWLAERMSGACFDRVRPVEMICNIRCPMFVILPEGDFMIDTTQRASLIAAVLGPSTGRGPRRVYSVASAGHLLALAAEPVEYPRQLNQFLSEALAAHGPRVSA